MKTLKLFEPYSYKKMKLDQPEALAEIVNGCGPSGWLSGIVPDTPFGFDFSGACDIHDYQYHFGETEEEKMLADRLFYRNLTRCVKHQAQDKPHRWVGYQFIKLYFAAVRDFGGDAFWEGKEKAA
jgi:hypothetical protein